MVPPSNVVEAQFTVDVISRPPVAGGSGKAPTIAAAQHAIADIYSLLHPKRQTGHGHKMHGLRPFVARRLEEMLTFLRVYVHGTQEWTKLSLVAAKFLGRGSYLAKQLRRWSLA